MIQLSMALKSGINDSSSIICLISMRKYVMTIRDLSTSYIEVKIVCHKSDTTQLLITQFNCFETETGHKVNSLIVMKCHSNVSYKPLPSSHFLFILVSWKCLIDWLVVILFMMYLYN
ncbi:hypothetical protein VP01_488g1 [Puccinia sorghi]|uniref:Uncharacterized protein n=1 Tax=Puccinia sorghi TaxID=27349 RepID=A0A0L6UM78_9BASI|nr:hypothetical protein VP01_488g1 [Puccinia sorghi]